jgi:hypothetical protein
MSRFLSDPALVTRRMATPMKRNLAQAFVAYDAPGATTASPRKMFVHFLDSMLNSQGVSAWIGLRMTGPRMRAQLLSKRSRSCRSDWFRQPTRMSKGWMAGAIEL